MKRLPNGYGGITKYKGNRKNPYRAWIPKKIVNSGSLVPVMYNDVEEIAEIVRTKEFTNKSFESELLDLIRKYSKEELEIKTKRITLGYYPTYQDALNSLAEYNKMPVDGDIKSMTFKDVWLTIKPTSLKGLSKQTQYHWNRAFENCYSLHSKKITNIKPLDMQRVVDMVAESSPSQQRHVVTICKAVFDYAMENDITTKNYASSLKMQSYEKGKKETFSDEEIMKLWKNIDYEHQSKRGLLRGVKTARIIIILLYTGLRIAELINIRKEDIHIEERYIEVHGTKTDNAERIVPIHKDIMHLMECQNWLIERPDGEQLTYQQCNTSLLASINKDLGMNHTYHETRHSFITRATVCNVNERLLHKIVGHAGENMEQEVYLHADLKYLQYLIEEIDKIVLPIC